MYRAFVPVYVAPPAPQIDSISVDGQTVTGSTTANNSSTATELSFNISGRSRGATVSVYIDGGATPIATGTVGRRGVTTITLTTTDGTTTIPSGSHEFTVEQTIATTAPYLFADFTETSPGPSPELPNSPSSGQFDRRQRPPAGQAPRGLDRLTAIPSGSADRGAAHGRGQPWQHGTLTNRSATPFRRPRHFQRDRAAAAIPIAANQAAVNQSRDLDQHRVHVRLAAAEWCATYSS